ncbi:DUF4083 family protein [Bacillus sp. FSL K6-3431]|uniref:DUF4083 family protein n=1 Tax=Bacillus sp. FSL K6-3431 TaxID=2921500 RepID=UPI0030F579ED
MEAYSNSSTLFIIIVMLLVILFTVSFGLFIRKLIVQSPYKDMQSNEIEKKLDKIITLLEEQKKR